VDVFVLLGGKSVARTRGLLDLLHPVSASVESTWASVCAVVLPRSRPRCAFWLPPIDQAVLDNLDALFVRMDAVVEKKLEQFESEQLRSLKCVSPL
jgi:hypothetical protein